MISDAVGDLRKAIRDVPDFPIAGIIFKDITPILCDGALFRAAIDLFLERCRSQEIDKVVCIDARGFLFGSAVAYELGIGLVPIRKTRKAALQDRARRLHARVRRSGNGDAHR